MEPGRRSQAGSGAFDLTLSCRTIAVQCAVSDRSDVPIPTILMYRFRAFGIIVEVWRGRAGRASCGRRRIGTGMCRAIPVARELAGLGRGC